MPQENTEQISEEMVWDVLEFARQSGLITNLYSPELVNARLKDTNLNPLAGTAKDIEKALANPKNSEQQLIGFSDFFEMTDMLYKREILYLGNLPSWDLTFNCINAKKEDYKKDSYKRDEKIVFDFLNKFNIKKEFSKVLRQLIRKESHFCVLRDDGEKYLLQELPQKHCKITGYWDYGILFDFDMMWFISNPGVDIDMYPKAFKKYLNRVKKVANNKEYDPGVKAENRNGSWIYWVQTCPEDKVWAWKFNPETVANIPFFSPLFPDLVLKPLIRKLQTDKYIIEASKVLMGLIPLLKDSKSGNVKDMLAISPEVAGKFANLVRQGLPKEIQYAMGPYSDVKSFEWKSDGNNMMDEYNKVTVGQSGTNARLLYATDRMNAEETRTSLSIDEQVATYIYPYFEDFLNYHINKKTKKFKFKFTLEGTNMPSNREKRLNDAMTLAQSGMVLPQKISAAIGMQYNDFKTQLEMANAEGFVESLTPLLTSYTMNGNDKGGRPKSKDSEISDSGMQTRDSGSNIDKGGDE